jgi:hypothetical protein
MVSPAAAEAAPASDQKKGSSIKNMISGGVAGAIAKTSVAPIERVKILFQVSTRQHLHIGIIDTLVNIAKNEGVRAYWKGNWANCSRVVPYAAVQYMAHEHAKKLLYGTRFLHFIFVTLRACTPRGTRKAWSLFIPCHASAPVPLQASSACAQRILWISFVHGWFVK